MGRLISASIRISIAAAGLAVISWIVWDVNDEFLSRLGAWHAKELRNVKDNEALLTGNEIFRARTVGGGQLPPEMAKAANLVRAGLML